ncbi:MAG: hypothetical protein ROZ64_06945 [Burkholderiaceae bacterium]|jgi:FtsZ-binding cell division protein ZapB|nr:hypothetical protein [Burkholderiaceae bacterium]
MALFRRGGPVVFEPYGYRKRRSWGIPRWLVLLLVGIAIGAGGLLYVQQEYLPQRLSPEESQRLQARVEELSAERDKLQSSLADATKQLEARATETKRLSSELSGAREQAQKLQQDIVLFQDVLPADPRDGAIDVRAARFANDNGKLAYHVLLTREAKAGKPFRGVIQFVVSGARSSGANATVTLDPIQVNLASYEHLQGVLPLPEGFTARQTTIRVLDAPNGRQQGMRVINVR